MRRIFSERSVMFALLVGAALACLLGFAKPPIATSHMGFRHEAFDLVRVILVTCLAVTLVMGPGIAVRALLDRPLRLAFLPLFGIGAMILTGCLAWSLHGVLATEVTCIAVVAPLLGLLLGVLFAVGPEEELLSAEERRTLLLVGIPVGLGVARSLWSLGPVGELDAGLIAHNLWTEGRPDSHTSYVVTEMVAHGTRPYGPEGAGLFAPYMFSSRGPAAGVASAPIVLVSGGRPILGVPNQHWEPFDAQGFMAYRIAMIVMCSTALLTLWELVRKLAGAPAARLAVVLGISTPSSPTSPSPGRSCSPPPSSSSARSGCSNASRCGPASRSGSASSSTPGPCSATSRSGRWPCGRCAGRSCGGRRSSRRC
jgi:hypothetical protein